MVQILSIGELIHMYRHKQGMALSQLTTLTGIHKATISKIENGEVRRPEWIYRSIYDDVRMHNHGDFSFYYCCSDLRILA
ncbi:helix-turn-helix domain-containing protein [Paenibacillus alvei]|uniref:helix-turn-helix domain-containing protein n=1 Tax=Paenibacillus alvei TaxID=44250 RepID=UPI0010FD0E3F